MSEEQATYSVDSIIATHAADQDVTLATNTAEAIVAHFSTLLTGGIKYDDAVAMAAKFSDVLLDQYIETSELTFSSIFGGE